MAIVADRNAYFRSMSEELLSQSRRVRNLIADRHWLSDGHQKEYLLTSLLVRHLPSNMLISRGFVADPAIPELCSDEQDVLVVDTSIQGPLFNQGGLLIALPSTVVATISVKSAMTSASIKQTVENQNSVREVLVRSGQKRLPFWSAGYFFEVAEPIQNKPTSVFQAYERAASKYRITEPAMGLTEERYPGPNLLCTSSDLAYSVRVTPDAEPKNGWMARILGYRCNGLATAILLASFIEHIEICRGVGLGRISELLDHDDISQLDPPQHAFKIKKRS